MVKRNDTVWHGRRAIGRRLTAEEMSAARKRLDAWRKQALEDPRLTPSAFRVAYALSLYVDWLTLDGACVAHMTLAERTSLNKRTVMDGLKLLQKLGYISADMRWNASKKYALMISDIQESSLLTEECQVQDFSLSSGDKVQDFSLSAHGGGKKASPRREVQEKSLSKDASEGTKCSFFHPESAGKLTSKVKKTATYRDSVEITVEGAVASAARLRAPAVAPSQSVVADRDDPQIDRESTPLASSLSRLSARSEAKEYDCEEEIDPDEIADQIEKERREEARDEAIEQRRRAYAADTALDDDIPF